MTDYRGCWMVCLTCKFPIRLPEPKERSSIVARRRIRRILLACPVCANVHSYASNSLDAIQFRTADPFRNDSAILYRVLFRCAVGACRRQVAIHAVGATRVSVARLFGVWKFWNLHLRCKTGHLLHAPAQGTWVVSRQSSLQM